MKPQPHRFTLRFANETNAYLAACLLLARTAVAAPIIAGPFVNPENDRSYYLLGTESWTDSQADALAIGGNLATIRNQAENDWVFSTFGSFGGVNRNLWIGFYDPKGVVAYDGFGPGSAHDLNFQWVDGEPRTFVNWSTSTISYGPEPNNFFGFGSDEYYGEILPPGDPRAGFWNDLPNQGNNPDILPFGVVEVVPEPSTMVLFGLGVLGLFLAARRRNKQGSTAHTP